MKIRRITRNMLAGLLSVLLLALSPSLALAIPSDNQLQGGGPPQAVSLAFDALEIFAQETHVLAPRSTGTITNNTTAAPEGLPQGTTMLFVIGGVAASIDTAAGRWTIGSQPVTVYESSSTLITGAPVVGDEVRIVGKRTVAPGPIVASSIAMVNRAPQPSGPAVVSTAFLFNGVVSVANATSWSVNPPAPAVAVSFNILPTGSAIGPTVIGLGFGTGSGGGGGTGVATDLGVGSAVTVEYIVHEVSLSPVQLASGWNMLSTPVLLKADADTMDKIFDAANLAKLEVAYAWSNGQWTQVTTAYELLPLSAIYVKVAAGPAALAVFAPSADISAPPSRTLTAGANLVGPAPAPQGGAFSAMPSSQAFVSIEKTAGGATGYVMLVSPGLNQPAWSYAIGGQAQDVLPYKGYWVIMENADTLYGLSTTPLAP